MIRIDCKSGIPACVVDVRERCSVYLDNDAIIELAKHKPDRRARFVASIRKKGSLLFSIANVIEIMGPKKESANKVRTFLDSIEQFWAPLEMNYRLIVGRELSGDSLGAPISMKMVEAYFHERIAEHSNSESRLFSIIASDFFRLGSLFDWVQVSADGQEFPKSYKLADLDKSFQDEVAFARKEYEKDPGYLDRVYPPISFSSKYQTRFAWIHLMRNLIIEAKSFHLKAHDALDFRHAVVGSSTARIATLDRHWKRRVEKIPKPNGLAKIFYRPQLDDMVDLLENLCDA